MKKKVIIVLGILLFVSIGCFLFFYISQNLNKPGKCLITTPLNCNQLKKVQVDKPTKTTRLEFNSAGNNKIFSPITGKCKEATSIYNGNGKEYRYIGISGNAGNQDVIFSLIFNSGLSCPSENIKAGTLLGYIKKSPMSDYNNHDLVIMALSKKTINNYSYYDTDKDLINSLLK